MSDLSQEDRIGKLTTPAGGDTFVLNRFEGTEGLGALFEYRVGALSLKENFDLNSMIGRNCNVRIKAVDGLERHFNGVLTEANYTGGQYGLFGYQLVLRPWLHLLSRTSDCRTFEFIAVSGTGSNSSRDAIRPGAGGSALARTRPA